MKIKIDFKYDSTQAIYEKFEEELDFGAYCKEHNIKLYSEGDIIATIIDYYFWEADDTKIAEILVSDYCIDGSEDITITNEEEIIKKYEYLIIKHKCCDGQTGNYCSTCGKKLKE